jgi:hypothetical protein
MVPSCLPSHGGRKGRSRFAGTAQANLPERHKADVSVVAWGGALLNNSLFPAGV